MRQHITHRTMHKAQCTRHSKEVEFEPTCEVIQSARLGIER
jgi:hypothetical protein